MATTAPTPSSGACPCRLRAESRPIRNHELRTPITLIAGHAEGLLRRGPQPPPQAGRVTASFVVAQRLPQAPEGAWLQRVDAALYAAMLEAVLDQIGWLGILFCLGDS